MTKTPHFCKVFIFAILLLVCSINFAQTNPPAQTLPYSQNFGTTTFSSLPTGTAAWTTIGAPILSIQNAEASSTKGDATITTASTAQTAGGCYGYATAGDGRFYIQSSADTTNGNNQFALAINTVGWKEVKISYDVEMISANPKTIGLFMQYRIGTSGAWSHIPLSEYYHNSSSRSSGAIDSVKNIHLSLIAMNNPVVQLRWVTFSGTEVGNYSGVAIDNIAISASASSAGGGHSLFLCATGGVYQAGANFGGFTPTLVPGTGGVIAVSAGGVTHNLAIVSPGGNVIAWGDNQLGSLGDGTLTNSYGIPVNVILPSGSVATSVAAGDGHSLALVGGQVYAWGNNNAGQLGLGFADLSAHPVPVLVPGLPSNITKVSAGTLHSVALTATGEVYAWGYNWNGQIGDNNQPFNRLSPIQVAATIPNIVAISAAEGNTMILDSNGDAYGTGFNGPGGQLGNGSPTSSPIFVTSTSLNAIGFITDISSSNATLALRSDGTVWACGDNGWGQRGDGTTITTTLVTQTNPPLSCIKTISAGWFHGIAINTSGVPFVWGNNLDGQLGLGALSLPITYPSPQIPLVTCTLLVPPTSLVVTGINTVCLGTSTNLTVTGGFYPPPYVWTGPGIVSTGVNTAFATPTTTTTYTVTDACGFSATFTVTVNTTPIVTVNSDTICSGQTAALTAGGAATYTWSAGATPTGVNTANASPTATTTYTVTGSTAGGCSGSAVSTVTVVAPACCNVLDYDIAPGSNVTAAFPGFTTGLSSKTIRIQGPGTFTINVANFSFSGCNVILMPGARIDVPSSTVLQLSNKTHLFGCSNMWDGIYVLAGGTLLVNSNSMIEDALKAVNVASNGSSIITDAIFNRNFTSIDLTSNSNAVSPITVTSSVFTCRNIPTFSLATSNYSTGTVASNVFIATPTWASITLKVPYSSYKSNYGIKGTDVKVLNIGNVITTYNGFDNLGNGIYLTNGASSTISSATIYGNKFQNMINGLACFPTPCPMHLGIGIYASGTASGNNTISIGSTLATQMNTFNNLYSSIEVNNLKQVNIIKNRIVNASTLAIGTFYGFGKIGIKIQPSAANTLEVTQNTVGNCATGIWINRTITGINALQEYIDGNTITANASGYCTNAINITDVANTGSTTPIDKIKVRNNIITGVYNCVTATNVKNGLIVYQNPTLSMRNNGTTAVNGIRFQNCNLGRIHDNPNITISPTVTPVTSTNVNYKGISVTTSLNAWISCNKIFSMGESMVFVGNSSWASVFNNQMTSGNRGLVLRSNGEIGTQGTTTQPCGLWWNNSFAAQTYTEATTNVNTNSILYVTNTGAPAGHIGVPTLNFGLGLPATYYTSGTGLRTGTGSLQTCSIAIAMMAPPGGGEEMSLSEIGELADDSYLYPVYEEEAQYKSKEIAFDELVENGTTGLGEELQNFYDSTSLSALGQLRAVDEAIANGNYIYASTLNSNVAPANLIEINQKAFNDLFLFSLNDDSYQYSQTELDDLYAVAVQCPLAGGNAVWQSRVLYWTAINDLVEFIDDCYADAKSMTNNSQVSASASSSAFKMYPNPNNGLMTLDYHFGDNETGTLEVYDLTGRILKSFVIQPRGTQLAINSTALSAGQYYYVIRVNGQLVKTEKLSIIK